MSQKNSTRNVEKCDCGADFDLDKNANQKYPQDVYICYKCGKKFWLNIREWGVST